MENTTAGIIAGTGALGVVGGAGVGGLGLLSNSPVVTLTGVSVAGLSLIPLAGGVYKLVSGHSKSNSTMGNDNVTTPTGTQRESERELLQPNTNTVDNEIPEWQRLGLRSESEYQAACAAAEESEKVRKNTAANGRPSGSAPETDNDLTDEEAENYSDDYTERTQTTRTPKKTESSSDDKSKTSSSDISDDEFVDAKETFEEQPVKTTWLGSETLGNLWNWGAGKLGDKSQTQVQQEEPQGSIVDGGSSERTTATTPQPAPKPRGASPIRSRDQVPETRDEARPSGRPPEENSGSRTSGLPRQKTVKPLPEDRARIVNSSDNPDGSDVDQSLANPITKDNADLTAAQHRKKQPNSRRRETRQNVALPNTADPPVQATKNVRFGATTFGDEAPVTNSTSTTGPSNNSTPTPSRQQKPPSPPPQSTTRDLPTRDRQSVTPIPNRTPINTTNLSAEEIAAAERVKAREVRRPAFGSTAPESRMTSLRTSTRDRRSVTPTPNRTPINTTNLSAEEIAAAERVRAREIQPPFSAAPRPKREYSPDPIFRK